MSRKLRVRFPHSEAVFAWCQIVLGCVIGGAAYPLFLTPNHIAPGGLTGVTTILNYLWGLPVGLTSLLMNIPLFLLSYRAIGLRFALRSLAATVLFSLSIDLVQVNAFTENPLLASLYGGVMSGVGFGMIMRGGATTGGTDMIARMIHRRLPTITVGTILFVIDFCVVVAAGFTMGADEALYAIITIFAQSRVIDLVLVGFTSNKACFIISEKWEPITHRLLHDMDRGVTQLKARGAWSGVERPLLLCVIGRQELPQLKQIVQEEDESAFLFITEAFEALGEGFGALSREE